MGVRFSPDAPLIYCGVAGVASEFGQQSTLTAGGMDTIVEEVAKEAAKAALDRANIAVRKANIRLVKAA